MLIKNSTIRELEVIIKLIFRSIFQFSIFILKTSSKRCLNFLYSFGVFEISVNIWYQGAISNGARSHNHWVFVYELNGCGFEPCCSHLNFEYRACLKEGVPWHSGNCSVWIHSKTRTWHVTTYSQELSFNHILKECLISKENWRKRRHCFDQRLFELHRWKF